MLNREKISKTRKATCKTHHCHRRSQHTTHAWPRAWALFSQMSASALALLSRTQPSVCLFSQTGNQRSTTTLRTLPFVCPNDNPTPVLILCTQLVLGANVSMLFSSAHLQRALAPLAHVRCNSIARMPHTHFLSN